LIVIGAHGVGESNNAFIGSTAQKVLRTTSCPVLSVKKDFKPSFIKKILFTSDFERKYSGCSEHRIKIRRTTESFH
jgi:hypothetical protein